MLYRTTTGKLVFVLLLSVATVGTQSRVMAATAPTEGQQDDGQGTQLRARAQRIIKGIEAELRGDFQSQKGGRDDGGQRKRLRGELDNINLTGNTEISFCLATSNGSVPLAAVKLSNREDDQKSAQFEIDSQNGDSVPNAVVGNKLEARQGGSSGKADCGAPLLISARFHR
jgi:hypothetical protein